MGIHNVCKVIRNMSVFHAFRGYSMLLWMDACHICILTPLPNTAGPPSAPVCSSFTPSSAGEGMIDVVFNWTAPFDGGESIDRYQVTPPPDPCGSPVTNTSNQYQCSGLRMDEMYNFIVRAVNCNNQEGPESGIITVTPQGELIVTTMCVPRTQYSIRDGLG